MKQQSKRRRALRNKRNGKGTKGNTKGTGYYRCRKLAFKSEERALEELEQMKALNMEHIRVYQCKRSECKEAWHLTSKSMNPKKKEDDR